LGFAATEAEVNAVITVVVVSENWSRLFCWLRVSLGCLSLGVAPMFSGFVLRAGRTQTISKQRSFHHFVPPRGMDNLTSTTLFSYVRKCNLVKSKQRRKACKNGWITEDSRATFMRAFVAICKHTRAPFHHHRTSFEITPTQLKNWSNFAPSVA
jgi:hypothetical protein